MKKKITCSVILLIGVIIFGLLFFGGLGGDPSLGDNFSLFKGDKKEDQIIVYCTHESNDCNGGIYVLPTYERHYNPQGEYAEYVEDAESNDGWIVVKTYQIFEKKNYYWIIDKNFSLINADCNATDCDAIIQEHVMGPFSFPEFNDNLVKYEIDIDFE